jgi:hypothetical protein
MDERDAKIASLEADLEVLAMLDAREFERRFVLWAQSLKGPLVGSHCH